MPAGARLHARLRRSIMAKGGRETKKPKKDRPKTNAAAPSTKGTAASAPATKK